jgi:hypothetical protein
MKRTYITTDDGIITKFESMENKSEGFIEYDQIGYRTAHYTSQKVMYLVLAVVLLVLSVFLLGTVIKYRAYYGSLFLTMPFFALSLGAWFKTRLRGQQYYSAQGTLTFLGNKKQLQQLVDEIPTKKLSFINSRVQRRLDAEMRDDALKYLLYLRENLIINEEMYDEFRRRHGFSADKNAHIGFASHA